MSTPPVEIELEYSTRVNYAMQQNGLPIINLLRIFNRSEENLEELTVTTEILPDICPPTDCHVAAIAADTTYNIRDIPMALPPERLVNLAEREMTTLSVVVRKKDLILASKEFPLKLLAYNEWPGTSTLPELVAAFILPNHPDIGPILRRASDILADKTGSPSLDGYQSKDIERARAIVASIYEALQSSDLTYVNPPASFEIEGQKVRTPELLLKDRMGTCLDFALLFAAVLEQAGLFPLVILCEGHALTGCWLTEEHFPESSVADDPRRLRKRIRLGVMTAVDVTALSSRPSLAFELAEEKGMEWLEEPGETFCAIDVRSARMAHIRPVQARSSGENYELVEGANLDIVHSRGTPMPIPSEQQGYSEQSAPQSATRLDRWKEKLLDLSLRNRLLNFKDTKTTLRIICPSLTTLEDSLSSGSAFKLLPYGEQTEEAIGDAFGKSQLFVKLSENELAKNLTQTYRKARLSLEESGANTLYLALGMLHWYETPTAQQLRRAPILLVAASLTRISMREGFTISLTDEEPLLNLTLVKKLETDFGIKVQGLDPLPEDDSGIDVAAVMSTFRQAILGEERWEVLDEAYLGHFSFTKHLMWRDLENNSQALLQNDVVHHLVETPTEKFAQEGDFPQLEDLDDVQDKSELFCPLDADSSQLAAVIAAEKDMTFVLEGPPGTGKSQTIANLMAHCLALGKRVLFVSEKMAALNVVYNRLATIGLEPFCLELHSNKVRKQHVLEQLRLAFEISGVKEPRGFRKKNENLLQLRSTLNSYVSAIHTPRSFGKSVYDVTARVIELRSMKRINLSLGSLEDFDEEELETLASIVRELVKATELIGEPAEHPFVAAQLRHWEPALTREVEFRLQSLEETVPSLRLQIDENFASLGLPASESIDWQRLEATAGLFGLLLRAPSLSAPFFDDEQWSELVGMVRGWIAKGRRRDELRDELGRRYDIRALLQLDLPELREKYKEYKDSFFLVRWVALMGSRGSLEKAARRSLGTPSEVLADLEMAMELHQMEKYFEVAEKEGKRVLADRWQEGDVDWASLDEAIKWVEEYQEQLETIADIDTKACLKVKDSKDKREKAKLLVDAFAVHSEERLALDECLDFDLQLAWGLPGEGCYFDRLKTRIEMWREGIPRLRDWCPFVEARHKAEEVGLTPLVHALAKGEIAAQNLYSVFERSFLEEWLEAIVGKEEKLRTFRGKEHNETIKAYAKLDQDVMRSTAQIVQAQLASRLPEASKDAPDSSELGILQRELKKQRRHRPVRWLLQNIPTLLPRLCPCLLMSPLSVAQYLPPDSPPFDLVVFDEASQIPVWDAIGAIARGKKLVVVGDSRQLPPTMFFQKGENEEVASEDDLEELESILDECSAAGLPKLFLKWHYRSRHESLITFSNHHYYDGRLFTFPSPFDKVSELGVEWRHVAEGVYERGSKQTNRMEAEALVAEVVARLKSPDHTGRSIGIVTFSMAQQNLIEDLLDEARQAYPEIDPFFSAEVEEPIFVKNLENVQGDERSVMLFSVCYGPDERGKVAMNFGPLNRQGGERRLNVAITRAREKLIVFSTLTPDQISLERTAAIGVKHLKTFLEFAAKGSSAIGEATIARSEYAPDGFKQSIGKALSDEGFECLDNIGCSGYRMALAVKAPEEEGRFVLGIECDGPIYRAAHTARDRDRLRDQVLEGLGWQLHRLWSADWWIDEQGERERLLSALKNAQENGVRCPAPITRVEPKVIVKPLEQTKVVIEEKVEVGAAELPLGAKEYVCWSTEAPLGKADDFYSPSSAAGLIKTLGEIVEIEAPISLSLATKRLANSWGVTRITKKVRNWVSALLGKFAKTKRPILHEDFLWHTSQKVGEYEGFRIPLDGQEPPRDCEDIPTIEYANGAERVLERSIALPHSELVKETARLFGFSRAGTKLKKAVAQGIELLHEQQRCVIDEERVTLP